MVDFLLQDGVCEALIGFITQVDSPAPLPPNPKASVFRPSSMDPQSEAMKLAYRAVILLSPENPSDALSQYYH
jgi:hypothetical protein